MTFNKKLISILIILLVVSLAFSAVYFITAAKTGESDKISDSAFAFNTIVTITLYGDYDKELIDQCFEICDTYETVFSRTDPESELYKLNHREISSVSDPVAEVIEKGTYYSQLSGGAFDIAVGALTDLWNFSAEEPSVPDTADIQEAIKHVDYTSVQLSGNDVTFSDSETMLDFGGIAKGYVADRIKDFLISQGVESAIINLGGNVLCIGGNPDGSDFAIGIQYPFEKGNKTIATVSLSDMSVVTSGIYERCFEQDGALYHHILDPKTGYPYNNGLSAVSIISDKSVDGDAISTVCFSLGLEDGLELINSMDGVYAIFVTDDNALHFSDGFKDTFKVSY